MAYERLGWWRVGLQNERWGEAMGNFNYGATANIFFGSSPLTIRSGAGVAQLMFNPGGSDGGIPFLVPPYGDAANDVPDINAGINGGC